MLGHGVTVFEARPKLGGLNEYGVAVRDIWSTSRPELIAMTPPTMPVVAVINSNDDLIQALRSRLVEEVRSLLGNDEGRIERISLIEEGGELPLHDADQRLPGRQRADDLFADNVLFRDADTPVLTDFGIARAEEQHRHFTEATQLFAGLEAADVRQADVEDDQIRRGLALMLQRRRAQAQPGRGEALALQGKNQRVGNRRRRHGNGARL